MKKVIIIISSVVGGIIAIIVTICLIVFGTLKSTSEANYYNIGKNQIPSIKMVAGERAISGVSTDMSNVAEKKDYTYSNIISPESDISKYMRYLCKSNGFLHTTDYNLNTSSGNLQLGAKASEPGEIIVINIKWNINEYMISLILEKGTLTKS